MSWEATSTLAINIVNKIKDEIDTIFINMVPSNIMKSVLKSTILQNCRASMFGDLTGDVQKVRKPKKTKGKRKGVKKLEAS